ncbi:MAG: hypothetical protein CO060_01950 [Candidatus Yonathbacteria bacterium CG_4_9_14_0_2_um_filter_43_16]|uniref:ComEC/Rec2-related protein domain-containing protein n=1 Tax=Candidatus Yonathbacteria bacterium CG_4_10_14_0_8_um_filter_43_17 TaxID=1975099 RepID=A0A2M7Q416_9BACT|nr:MAG: hypothetical protein COZ48_01095 [Candidatus Yonathbacteria bacterium CG_4_10_14_3_um_filter_43_12]PIY58167.1 MAG: hypothetical protein COY98_03195 [Candidatus Yonathbacteria bacterium CG_4_10_14_0_8_um_filter_43_17]PJC22025.1 MAG: hypothetical protein CO060_01950 [Candidatus Yonathbacteria bacterium CG_4_9_14_0_2_um_filter_43_16]
MRPNYFFGFIISFIVGVALESILDFGYLFAILFALLSLFVLLTPRVVSQSKSVLIVSLILFGVALGIYRVDVSKTNTSASALDAVVGEVLKVDGMIVGEPDVREEYTNVVIETKSVYKEKTRILVRTQAFPELKYGDLVSVVGNVTVPKNFPSDDNMRAFDYQSYLAKDGIFYQMYFPKVAVVSHGNGNVILEKLFAFKSWLIKNISQRIPEPEAALANGITLGAKQSLGEDLIQKFRETGIAHIVVLSGYNIAVVASIISRLVMFMPFSIRLIMSALGIILFAVMVGGGATVVRATLMALVVIMARMLGREGDALRVLVLAGGIMIFANPMIFLHDVSFQLSFSATLAIVIFVPIIEKYFSFISNRIFREIVVTTFATQIFVLPLILYHMGSVSLIGFISNIFILPVVPIAMMLVALVAIFSWVPLVGSLLSFVAYALLSYIITLVEFFALMPFASLHGIHYSFSMLVLAYGILMIVCKKSFLKTSSVDK